MLLQFESLNKLNKLDKSLYTQILDLGIKINSDLQSLYWYSSQIADIDEEIMDSVAKNYKEKLI